MSKLPAHSTLGASSYSRWKACPGSVKLCEGMPNKSSVFAEEGTRAHGVAEKILRGEDPGAVQEEMLSAVMVYVDYVKAAAKHAVIYEIEKKFDLTRFHPKLFGTADCVLYKNGYLKVIDYKHGQGVAVDVIDSDGKPNVQLMYYAVGALHAMSLPIKQIEITIVQPRCYHPDGPIRSTKVDGVYALEFLADLVADAKATEAPDAAINPGSHCRWCAAQAICPGIKQKALAVAQEVFSPIASYEPEKLSWTLDHLPMLEAYVKSVREFAYREAEMGRCPPGYKLVEKRAHRKWVDGAEKMLERKFSLHSHQMYDTKLKSPAQIEKILPKELRVQLDAMTVKESSGKSLVPESDSRQDIAVGAREAFGVIEAHDNE